jgi:hypothetical protein
MMKRRMLTVSDWLYLRMAPTVQAASASRLRSFRDSHIGTSAQACSRGSKRRWVRGTPAHDQRWAKSRIVASESVKKGLPIQALPLRVGSGLRETIKVSGKLASAIGTSDKGCGSRRPMHRVREILDGSCVQCPPL